MTAFMIAVFIVLLGLAGTGIDLLMDPKHGGGFRFTVYSVPILLFFMGCSVYFSIRKYRWETPAVRPEFYDPEETGSYTIIFTIFICCAGLMTYFVMSRIFFHLCGIVGVGFSP